MTKNVRYERQYQNMPFFNSFLRWRYCNNDISAKDMFWLEATSWEESQGAGESFWSQLKFFTNYGQGRWSMMHKGAHLRTQYFSLKLWNGKFCAPKFWPLLSNCAPNFEQVPPPLCSTIIPLYLHGTRLELGLTKNKSEHLRHPLA